MGEILGNLNFNWQAFVLNIFGFLLLLWVMNTLVFKPVAQKMAERQTDITTTYDKLESDNRQMATLKADYEQRLANIEAEAREKIQTAIKDAQSARDQIVNEAQTMRRDILIRAEAEAERERQQAMITMRGQIVDLALNAAQKVIGENLDDARNRRLVDDFIATGSNSFATASTAAPKES